MSNFQNNVISKGGKISTIYELYNTHKDSDTLLDEPDEPDESELINETSSEDTDESLKKKTIKSKFHYTISSKGYYAFSTTCYVIQEFIFEQKNLITMSKTTIEFEHDYKKYKEVIVNGNIVFEWKGELYNCSMDLNHYKCVIQSNNDISEIVSLLKRKIRYENPLRGKLFQIKQTGGEFVPIMKSVPSVTFDDIIMNKNLKEDIHDNTIFQLQNLDENNGVIFYGEPGVGKSLICSAISNESTSLGYTVCFLSTEVSYAALNEFLEQFVSPCILIFEDIDAFGQSREGGPNSGILSDFLQFINGISEKEERIIFIATTNYLEKLDKAISNRPVRFNRKFEFKYPTNEEIIELVKLYFNDDIAKKFGSLCYDKKFTGAHIKEIQRTSNLLSKKRNMKLEDVFTESVNLVAENFSTKLNTIGFKR